MASNLTISGIFLGSTGGSLMKRAKLDWPLTLTPTAEPLVWWRSMKFASAVRSMPSLLSPATERICSCSMISKSSIRKRSPSRTSFTALRARLPRSIPQAERALAMLFTPRGLARHSRHTSGTGARRYGKGRGTSPGTLDLWCNRYCCNLQLLPAFPQSLSAITTADSARFSDCAGGRARMALLHSGSSRPDAIRCPRNRSAEADPTQTSVRLHRSVRYHLPRRHADIFHFNPRLQGQPVRKPAARDAAPRAGARGGRTRGAGGPAGREHVQRDDAGGEQKPPDGPPTRATSNSRFIRRGLHILRARDLGADREPARARHGLLGDERQGRGVEAAGRQRRAGSSRRRCGATRSADSVVAGRRSTNTSYRNTDTA